MELGKIKREIKKVEKRKNKKYREKKNS